MLTPRCAVCGAVHSRNRKTDEESARKVLAANMIWDWSGANHTLDAVDQWLAA
jgi:hypothetical protein